ncbi:MAG: hypothetical protein CMN77_18520 [Spirochaetaceae bacterium]|nr:hypothetical protein [Spirochaetaceae bacterium]|tara:strand:- start:960 stop:1358 length:399 start_codon:yes stop_codon:yes gene_type:complete
MKFLQRIYTFISLSLAVLMVHCAPGVHGFQVKDGNCDCHHSFYFLSSGDGKSDPDTSGVELAMNGNYDRARVAFSKEKNNRCFSENNLGLVFMLQGQSDAALKHLWEAHSLCPDNETIEGNLKNLLSRIPAS